LSATRCRMVNVDTSTSSVQVYGDDSQLVTRMAYGEAGQQETGSSFGVFDGCVAGSIVAFTNRLLIIRRAT
jgi:hypothetical protein